MNKEYPICFSSTVIARCTDAASAVVFGLQHLVSVAFTCRGPTALRLFHPIGNLSMFYLIKVGLWQRETNTNTKRAICEGGSNALQVIFTFVDTFNDHFAHRRGVCGSSTSSSRYISSFMGRRWMRIIRCHVGCFSWDVIDLFISVQDF